MIDYGELSISCMGYEFYKRQTNTVAYLWEIHNTFTEHEIEMIKQDRNGLFGYREKITEE